MSDFSSAWALSRGRFLETISDLNQAQLNWRIHSSSLTIAEMAVHVAGVELSFASQLIGKGLSEEEARLKTAATDGVVNDKPFPFTAAELTPAAVAGQLARSKAVVEKVIEEARPDIRSREIVSALGPVITGEGAFARLAFHAAYHQGQAYLIRTSPGFPN